ncbi:sensor histidine kinase [Cryptosporangium arvum]|uniref:sensor histidine kinase n=1 Tax=Cryptosporangium arvum TaxID=80871 RepID=UPI0004B93C06|nr:histidine kinase [Cryptosporangium arvum]
MTPRERLLDAALAAFTTTAVSVAIAADLGSHRGPDVLAYGAAVVLGAVLLVRRRFPRGVLLVSAALLIAYYVRDYPPIGLPVPLGAALYTAAEAGFSGWAIAVSTGLLSISTYARLHDGEDPAYLFGYEILVTGAAMAATIALGDGIRSRRLLRAEQRERLARERTAHEQALSGALQAERLEVARDVHDAVGHTLTVVSLHTDVALEAVDDDPAATRRALENVRAACDTASAELRRALGLIRDATPPGLDELRELGVEVPPGLGPLPPTVEAAVFRIVQEAVTNARRYSGGSPISVDLRTTETSVVVEVRDGGDGPPADPGTGFGLVGLRERVALLGGRTEIGPRPEGGFRVWVALPR